MKWKFGKNRIFLRWKYVCMCWMKLSVNALNMLAVHFHEKKWFRICDGRTLVLHRAHFFLGLIPFSIHSRQYRWPHLADWVGWSCKFSIQIGQVTFLVCWASRFSIAHNRILTVNMSSCVNSSIIFFQSIIRKQPKNSLFSSIRPLIVSAKLSWAPFDCSSNWTITSYLRLDSFWEGST